MEPYKGSQTELFVFSAHLLVHAGPVMQQQLHHHQIVIQHRLTRKELTKLSIYPTL